MTFCEVINLIYQFRLCFSSRFELLCETLPVPSLSRDVLCGEKALIAFVEARP